MPVVKVIRPQIIPSVRKVPTSTCATVMPMTLERAGKEAVSDNEEAMHVQSIQEAFDKFTPKLDFRGTAGKEETDFRAEFHFRSIKDFEPENLQKRQEVRTRTKAGEEKVEYLRNDIADLKSNIDLLYRLKDRWRLPAVRRAWSKPEQREKMIEAFGRLRSEVERVAKGGNQ
jgi:type VI secretion system protein ImpB